VQTAAGAGGSFTIVTHPYTSATDTDLQIVADGSSRGKITVTVKDTYGNLRTGDTVAVAATGLAGVVLSPTTTTADSNGQATFDISSTDIGNAAIQVTVNAVNYGSSFTVHFKSDDRTPPTINTQSSAFSLASGDIISASEGVSITVSLTDPGTNASGVDLTSISVTVTDSGGGTHAGTPSTAGCTVATSCTVTWTPAATLPAGQYKIAFSVQDNNGNIQTQEWTVKVTGGTQLVNIAAGPSDGSGVFNPLAGGTMKFSFQAPSSGAVVLEIYRRDGRMVYSTTGTVVPGYNEIEWDGRGLGGGHIANGVYVFRLRASLATGVTEQTGKMAIFKK
jgi:flagellar hook assembly protein FlgD